MKRLLTACALLGIGCAVTAVVFLALDGFKPTTRSILFGALAFTFIVVLKLAARRSGGAPSAPR